MSTRIVLFTACCLTSLLPSDEAPRTPPAPMVPIVSLRLGLPSDADLDELRANSEAMFDVLVPRVEELPMQEPGAQLEDASLIDHIHRARAIIASEPELPGAWGWAEVQRAVEDIGEFYPLTFRTNDLNATIAFQFDYVNRVLAVFPFAAHYDAEELAEVVVHEATHIVQYQRLMAYGLRREELLALSIVCQDFAEPFRWMMEGLAHLNEGLWAHHRDRMPVSEVSEAAFRARDLRNERAARAFIRSLDWYVTEAQRIDESGVNRLMCGHVFIEHAPHQGEWFDPTFLSHDFIEPLWVVRMLDLSRH